MRASLSARVGGFRILARTPRSPDTDIPRRRGGRQWLAASAHFCRISPSMSSAAQEGGYGTLLSSVGIGTLAAALTAATAGSDVSPEGSTNWRFVPCCRRIGGPLANDHAHSRRRLRACCLGLA